MIQELIHDLGESFTPVQYIFWSRIEGTAWTLADVVIVLYVARIANLARSYVGVPGRVVPFILLALTLPPSALIPFVASARGFFMLEAGVTVPHFCIIVWLMVFDAPIMLQAVRERAGARELGSTGRPG